jgi:ribosomal protein S27E
MAEQDRQDGPEQPGQPDRPEALARDKFHCPACGADAHWSAEKQALVCPFCGTVSPMEIAANGEVKENDLAEAMRALPASARGWKSEKRSVKCQSCQAITVFDPARVAQRCEFCGSAQIVPYEEMKAPISPQGVLPFKIPQATVRDSLRQWYGNRWFAPNRLKRAALTDTVHGMYLPYWTFDAQVHADWDAESGYHYYVTETYRDSDGQTKTRQVQRTRWQHTSGSVDHFFDDQLVPATRGADPALLAKIEPFPTQKLDPYSAAYVAGWAVEQYQIDLIAAAQLARQRMESAVRSMCASGVPGDTHRNLRVHADFSGQTFKHLILPVWLVSFTYGRKSYQVLVNGVTGQIAGTYPKSAWKIFFLVVAILIAVGIFAAIASGR